MITITPEQIEALEKSALNSFVKRAIAHIRVDLFEHAGNLDGQYIEKTILKALSIAKTASLKSEVDIICLIDAAIITGISFENPHLPEWIQELLFETSVEPELRAAEILARAYIVAGSSRV